MAKLLVGCYVTMLFQHRVFHADPHPGNFLVRPGPQLVILDYGAVEEVTERLQQGMKRVVMGVMARNDDEILAGLERMGFVDDGGDRELMKRVGREYLNVLGSVKIDDFPSWIASRWRQLSATIRCAAAAPGDEERGVSGRLLLRRAYAGALVRPVGQLAPKLGLPGS